MTGVDLAVAVAEIMSKPGPVRLVAVDGRGGAGKTTFAARLAAAAGGAPVVHTDDFASWEQPVEWWPRLLREVIEPLADGRSGRYRRYDWSERRLAEWHTIDPGPIVIIEGVSAGRSEWAHHLAFVIWVDAPRGERLRRGIERDGPEAAALWNQWMAEEDAHFVLDPVHERADLVIDGTG